MFQPPCGWMSLWRDTIKCGLSGLDWHVRNTGVRLDSIALSYDRATRRLVADIKVWVDDTAVGSALFREINQVIDRKRVHAVPAVCMCTNFGPQEDGAPESLPFVRDFSLKHLPMHCIIYGKRFADCKVCRTMATPSSHSILSKRSMVLPSSA